MDMELTKLLEKLTADSAAKKAKKARSRARDAFEALPKEPSLNDKVAKQWAKTHTGTIHWEPDAIVLRIQRQTCGCCGQVEEHVHQQLFRYRGRGKLWMTEVAYGIENPLRLPIIREWVEPRGVVACAVCAETISFWESSLEDCIPQMELAL
jgi:hypothetical protein